MLPFFYFQGFFIKISRYIQLLERQLFAIEIIIIFLFTIIIIIFITIL